MRQLRPFLVVASLLVLGTIALAAQSITTSSLRLDGMPLVVTTLTPSGQAATQTGIDSDQSPVKHAIVHKWLSINGQEIDVLIRVQKMNGCLFVDVVGDATITSLSTTVGAMSLTGIGHPSPAKDVVDKQALVAAGGS